MNGEPCAVFFRRLYDGDAFIPGWCKGLLHDRGKFALRSQCRERFVTVHAGRDVDQVKRAIIEHAARIRVPLHAELLACSTRLGFVLITYCDKVGAMTGKFLPCMQMVLGVEPASDQTDTGTAPAIPCSHHASSSVRMLQGLPL